MRQKLLKFIGLGVLTMALLTSCRTGEEVSNSENGVKEKIAFFERFESQNPSSHRRGASLNYALPFAQSINAYFSLNPEVGEYFQSKYGNIDEKVSSQSIDGESGEKLLFFPVLDNDRKVVAVLSGVVNGDRDYLYYDVWQDENSDVRYLVDKFQEYYDGRSHNRGSGDIEEVIIIVLRPIAKTNFDGWLGGGNYGNGGNDGGHLASGGAGNYGGSGSSTSTNTQNEPCEKAKSGSEKSTETSKSSAFTDAKTSVTGMNNGKENGVVFGNVNGEIQSTGVQTGSSNSVNLSHSFTNPLGSLHNHPNNNPPSPGDIYALINANNQYVSFGTSYVITENGTVYALVVTNINAMNTFLQSYPPNQVPGYGPNFPGQMFQDWYNFTFDGLGNKEMALSYILDKYNVGVALTKLDNNENFKKINVTENYSNGTTTYTQTNCP